jgi:hypothetical protein
MQCAILAVGLSLSALGCHHGSAWGSGWGGGCYGGCYSQGCYSGCYGGGYGWGYNGGGGGRGWGRGWGGGYGPFASRRGYFTGSTGQMASYSPGYGYSQPTAYSTGYMPQGGYGYTTYTPGMRPYGSGYVTSPYGAPGTYTYSSAYGNTYPAGTYPAGTTFGASPGYAPQGTNAPQGSYAPQGYTGPYQQGQVFSNTTPSAATGVTAPSTVPTTPSSTAPTIPPAPPAPAVNPPVPRPIR